jgi:uncharacterized membrane protein (UPF0127 family)
MPRLVPAALLARLAFVFALALLAACDQFAGENVATLHTATGDWRFTVEIADTDSERARGLMYRQELAPDAGMLFDFEEERPVAFWMQNTLIPLDMLFITKDLTVAGIVENAEPQTDTLRKVGATSLYVLEVNGGYAASHGVAAGAKVRFENTEGAAH